MRHLSIALLLLGLLTLAACSGDFDGEKAGSTNDFGELTNMDAIAESYVKLVLEVGLYDPDYVDAYYGPDEWRPAAESKHDMFPFKMLQGEAVKLQTLLKAVRRDTLDEVQRLRLSFLSKQLVAVLARIDMLSGKKLTFDEETQLLYDAKAPIHDENYFKNLLSSLDRELSGSEDLTERLHRFQQQFVIPKDRLDAVFQAAISEARKRTLARIELPDNENFEVEYVTDKAWSGYNWYKGNSFSLIQVNTDLPIYIDRAIDLACHEGYPGHHVFNALLEKHLVRERGWVEFSVYPLFSPQSLIAEGSANYGIEMAFPGEERVEFEKNVLFAAAGIAPSLAEKYNKVQALVGKLSYAGNEAARNYLDGKISAQQAIDWLTRFALMAPERAEQRIKFIEKYRGYVINYNLGLDLVRQFVESNGGTMQNPDLRWQLFTELLSTPRVASALSASSN